MHFTTQPGFTAVNVGWDEATGSIGQIVLNRPSKSNAFNTFMWREFPAVSCATEAC
jgi:enoyl-CoA hydratase/carnithine racemase